MNKSHSHDTATPALSVENEYVLVPREPTPEMELAFTKAYLAKDADIASPYPTEHPDDGGGAFGYGFRAMISAAPTLSASHLAKEGGEAVVVPYDDFHAAYQFVPRSKMSPDHCLKTRLRSLLRGEDLAHADEAEALAAAPAPNPSPAAKGGEAEAFFCEAVVAARQQAKRECSTLAETVRLRAEERRSERADAARIADDAAVDAFAGVMKAKLAAARAKGRSGWQDKEACPSDRLSRMLREHVEKGDPIDVANFCMMLSQRSENIATPSPQPADAVREALIDARNNGLIYWEPNTGRGHASKALMLARIDAALASDPAPAGEAVELWHCVHKGSDNDFWTSEDKTAEACAASGRYDVSRKTLHPAPEDTARLREDLAEAVRQIEANIAVIERSKEFVQKATSLAQTAERERDDARKALETAREDERDRLLEELLNSCMGPTAMDAINRFLREHGAMFLEDRAATRSASREGASDE